MKLRRRRPLLWAMPAFAAAAWMASAVPTRAGANNCTYNGQDYGEGAVICQAGLLNLCMNGVWQSKGSFCNGTPDGAVVGGGGSLPVIIEVPAPAADE